MSKKEVNIDSREKLLKKLYRDLVVNFGFSLGVGSVLWVFFVVDFGVKAPFVLDDVEKNLINKKEYVYDKDSEDLIVIETSNKYVENIFINKTVEDVRFNLNVFDTIQREVFECSLLDNMDYYEEVNRFIENYSYENAEEVMNMLISLYPEGINEEYAYFLDDLEKYDYNTVLTTEFVDEDKSFVFKQNKDENLLDNIAFVGSCFVCGLVFFSTSSLKKVEYKQKIKELKK